MRNGTSRVLTSLDKAGTKKKDIFSGSGKQPFRKSLKFLFDETSSSRTSPRFSVDKCVAIAASNIKPEESVHVMQYVSGEPRAYMPIPGKIVRLSDKLTNIFVGHPGQYELLMSNPSMVGRVVIEYKKIDDCNYAQWIKAVGPLL